MDRVGIRLELLKLIWHPVGGGSPAENAIKAAKKLEEYVLESGIEPPTVPAPAVPEVAPPPQQVEEKAITPPGPPDKSGKTDESRSSFFGR